MSSVRLVCQYLFLPLVSETCGFRCLPPAAQRYRESRGTQERGQTEWGDRRGGAGQTGAACVSVGFLCRVKEEANRRPSSMKSSSPLFESRRMKAGQTESKNAKLGFLPQKAHFLPLSCWSPQHISPHFLLPLLPSNRRQLFCGFNLSLFFFFWTSLTLLLTCMNMHASSPSFPSLPFSSPPCLTPDLPAVAATSQTFHHRASLMKPRSRIEICQISW